VVYHDAFCFTGCDECCGCDEEGVGVNSEDICVVVVEWGGGARKTEVCKWRRGRGKYEDRLENKSWGMNE